MSSTQTPTAFSFLQGNPMPTREEVTEKQLKHFRKTGHVPKLVRDRALNHLGVACSTCSHNADWEVISVEQALALHPNGEVVQIYLEVLDKLKPPPGTEPEPLTRFEREDVI
jgi:hypothetical protein